MKDFRHPSSRATSRSILAAAAVVSTAGMLLGCTGDRLAAFEEPELETSEAAIAQLSPAALFAASEGTAAQAQAALGERRRDVPQDLLSAAQGHWVGTCTNSAPGATAPRFEFGIERIVQPTEDPNRFTWQLIYSSGGSSQLRDYAMDVVDVARGHYILDENNGVLLDSYYFPTSGLLISEFQVDTVRLLSRESFKGDKSTFEIYTTSVTPQTSSDVGGTIIDAFRVLSIQKCSLRRQN